MSLLSNLLGQDDAKLAANASKKATQTAEQQYAETGGLRKLGTQKLTQPGAYDFSADYAGAPTYRAVNDPLLAQATAAQGKSLADLSGGLDRVGMVKQTLADLDAANAPRLQAGIRK